jgi:hypothetical protein
VNRKDLKWDEIVLVQIINSSKSVFLAFISHILVTAQGFFSTISGIDA